MEYNLEERTAKFAESIIELSTNIKRNVVTLPLISQLVRAGTSVGANYCEANGASSRKDFRNKISICKKEIQETCYWLRIISKSDPSLAPSIVQHADEAHQLTLIFTRILATLDKNTN